MTVPAVEAQDGVAARVAIVERAQRGDPAAFEALYRERAGAVLRFAQGMLRNTAAAEDAAAETFLQAWRSLPSLRKPEAFDSWLFGIAQNVALRELRRRKTTALDDAPEPSDPDRWTDPPDVATTHDEALAVRAALLELPEDYRHVLVLRYYAELPHAEVARQLGKSEQNARVLQYRALKKLHSLLEEAGVRAESLPEMDVPSAPA